MKSFGAGILEESLADQTVLVVLLRVESRFLSAVFNLQVGELWRYGASSIALAVPADLELALNLFIATGTGPRDFDMQPH